MKSHHFLIVSIFTQYNENLQLTTIPPLHSGRPRPYFRIVGLPFHCTCLQNTKYTATVLKWGSPPLYEQSRVPSQAQVALQQVIYIYNTTASLYPGPPANWDTDETPGGSLLVERKVTSHLSRLGVYAVCWITVKSWIFKFDWLQYLRTVIVLNSKLVFC